ncbi:MAG: TetR family transcriptional regulator [Pyrinomonadaceae bacterium]
MTPKRWRRRKEARPGEILAAALECFAERGFAATRLSDVATRAGVTKGTLYLYFKSKEDLFEAVVRAAIVPNIARFEEMVATSSESAGRLLEQILMMLMERVSIFPVGGIIKLVIAEASNFPGLARFYLNEVTHRGFRLFAGLLRRGIERGEFRAVDVDSTVYCVIAPILITALWKQSLEPYSVRSLDAQAICRAHTEMLLRGLAPP